MARAGEASRWLRGTLSALTGVAAVITLYQSPARYAWILLACATLIAVHEVGHTVTGLVLGFRSYGFQVGSGPRLVRLGADGFRFDLHAWPFGGMALLQTGHARAYRLRFTLVLLGGVASEGAAAYLTFRYAGSQHPFPQTIVFAGLLGVVINLVPLKVRAVSGVPTLSELAYSKRCASRQRRSANEPISGSVPVMLAR